MLRRSGLVILWAQTAVEVWCATHSTLAFLATALISERSSRMSWWRGLEQTLGTGSTTEPRIRYLCVRSQEPTYSNYRPASPWRAISTSQRRDWRPRLTDA